MRMEPEIKKNYQVKLVEEDTKPVEPIGRRSVGKSSGPFEPDRRTADCHICPDLSVCGYYHADCACSDGGVHGDGGGMYCLCAHCAVWHCGSDSRHVSKAARAKGTEQCVSAQCRCHDDWHFGGIDYRRSQRILILQNRHNCSK